MQSLENLKLGKDDQRIRLTDREENRCASLALASQARRTIEIFSWDLVYCVKQIEDLKVVVSRG